VDRDLAAGKPDEQVEDVADADRMPRADVEDVAAELALGGQTVGAGDVANVDEVAAGVEVADLEDRLLEPALDARDLAGEGRRHELLGVARPVWLNSRSRMTLMP